MDIISGAIVLLPKLSQSRTNVLHCATVHITRLPAETEYHVDMIRFGSALDHLDLLLFGKVTDDLSYALPHLIVENFLLYFGRMTTW